MTISNFAARVRKDIQWNLPPGRKPLQDDVIVTPTAADLAEAPPHTNAHAWLIDEVKAATFATAKTRAKVFWEDEQHKTTIIIRPTSVDTLL